MPYNDIADRVEAARAVGYDEAAALVRELLAPPCDSRQADRRTDR